jgi:hypothetical protein
MREREKKREYEAVVTMGLGKQKMEKCRSKDTK